MVCFSFDPRAWRLTPDIFSLWPRNIASCCVSRVGRSPCNVGEPTQQYRHRRTGAIRPPRLAFVHGLEPDRGALDLCICDASASRGNRAGGFLARPSGAVPPSLSPPSQAVRPLLMVGRGGSSKVKWVAPAAPRMLKRPGWRPSSYMRVNTRCPAPCDEWSCLRDSWQAASGVCLARAD